MEAVADIVGYDCGAAMPPLAVSIGDPAGVGPEVIAKAWAIRAAHRLPPFFAIGDRRSIEAVWDGPIEQIARPADARAVFDEALPLLQVDEPGDILPGQPTLAGARVALDILAGSTLPESKLEFATKLPSVVPPEPFRWLGAQITMNALDTADAKGGWRLPWLKFVSTLGFPLH